MAPPSLLDVSRLGQWATQWDQLVDASPLPSPFLRSWWLTGPADPAATSCWSSTGRASSVALPWRSAIRCQASG